MVRLIPRMERITDRDDPIIPEGMRTIRDVIRIIPAMIRIIPAMIRIMRGLVRLIPSVKPITLVDART